MNIENHICHAKIGLSIVRDKVQEDDYDAAFTTLCNIMTDTRELIEHVWELKTEKALSARPAGD